MLPTPRPGLSRPQPVYPNPPAGLFPARQFALRLYTKPYVTPQELKDSIPLDGCIHNYDSAYHIIFTNVKTIHQFSPRTTGTLHPPTPILKLRLYYAPPPITSP